MNNYSNTNSLNNCDNDKDARLPATREPYNRPVSEHFTRFICFIYENFMK